MTSRNFKQSMVNQDQEIIFEVVKVSGSWVFPAASSIVEATRGKNMYLRLTDDGRSDIFRLDSVKDGENAGETVFGFVGNGGMDLVELTATTDGTGATTGSWDYELGEGPAGEAIGNLGQPLQWKGPATVAQLNDGITGIKPGWTYTLTDAGTLTDGSVTVDVGDEVAWTEDGEWFKVGGENSNVALFQFTGTDYPDGDAVLAELAKGKTVVLVKYTSGYGGFWYDYYYMDRRVSGNIGVGSATQLEFYPVDNSKKYIKAFKDLDAAEPTWVWSLEENPLVSESALAEFELAMLTNIPCANNTLRLKFSKTDYDPTVAGVGSSGTWKKLNAKFNNVWDWTNTNTSWATAFGGGSTTNPGAFADYENNPVKVIAAGDTSSVTDFSRFFQNCYAITEICPIDTSNATTVFLMFSHCENCSKFPDMDFSSAVASNGTAAVYQACYEMVSAPNIIFPTDHTYSLQNFFVNCVKLENVPLYDTSYCNNMQSMFTMDNNAPSESSLKLIPLFNTSRVTTMARMFQRCKSLEEVPNFDTSSVTNMSGMFFGGKLGNMPAVDMKLKSIPNFNYSKVTRFDDFANSCISLTEIPEMNIEANVTTCEGMFKDCPNVKSGQKALYDKLSAIATIAFHDDCFKNCGSDTEEGRAELAQIPTSWGGTMPNP